MYAGMSTVEQAKTDFSLRQQIEALRAYAARKSYEVFEQVQDAGQRGAEPEEARHGSCN